MIGVSKGFALPYFHSFRFFAHRAKLAFLAAALRCSGVMFAARFSPPRFPASFTSIDPLTTHVRSASQPLTNIYA
jgi:hypothetical protein